MIKMTRNETAEIIARVFIECGREGIAATFIDRSPIDGSFAFHVSVAGEDPRTGKVIWMVNPQADLRSERADAKAKLEGSWCPRHRVRSFFSLARPRHDDGTIDADGLVMYSSASSAALEALTR